MTSEGAADIVKTFKAVAGDPQTYAQAWKRDNARPVVGYFCSYAPEEIVLAAGALPYRLTGSGRQIRLADRHLQAYSCSLVRSAMEDVLGGHLGFLDGTVFPHTCDSIQRLSDMWRLNAGLPFHLDVVLPVNLRGPGSTKYMNDVLVRFRDELGKALGCVISSEEIRSAAAVYNDLRASLRSLYDLRRERPVPEYGPALRSC